MSSLNLMPSNAMIYIRRMPPAGKNLPKKLYVAALKSDRIVYLTLCPIVQPVGPILCSVYRGGWEGGITGGIEDARSA